MSNRPTVYEVKTAELNTMQDFRYVVIFARFKDKWIFCRHKERTTYESPGGRIEQGESCLQAARRELYEETGAIDFEITPMFDYSVNSSRGLSNGQVYFAKIKELGKLPESEIAFIEFFDCLPSVLTYPDIQPILFRKIKEMIKYYKINDEGKFMNIKEIPLFEFDDEDGKISPQIVNANYVELSDKLKKLNIKHAIIFFR